MKKLFFLLCLLPILSSAQPGYINTIAGNGTSGYSGDGGPATSAELSGPLGVSVDRMGNVYIADYSNELIRKIDTLGIISTIAGGGSSLSDSIPATHAELSLLGGGAINIDNGGNVYFIDNNRIRKINATTGIIITVVGTGTAGFSGDGGPAIDAEIDFPHGVCFDTIGNMYIGDDYNHRVRKVNTQGIITTYAGTGTSGFSGDGGAATAAEFASPDGLCMDTKGNLYIADRYNYRIRKIDASGVVSTYAGNGTSGFSGDGGPATSATFYEPSTVCMDTYGNLYVADFHNNRIRKITPAGIISTFAGGGSSGSSGIPATSASFMDTWGVGIDKCNNIYIGDQLNNRVCKVDAVDISTACWTTAVQSTQLAVSSPTVYPNPAADVLTIKADNKIFESYTITNSVGETFQTNKLAQSQMQINISALPSGLYFVNINGEQGSVVRKFVKM